MKKLSILLLAAVFIFACSTAENKTTSTDKKNLDLLKKNTTSTDKDFIRGKQLVLDGKFEKAIPLLSNSKEKNAKFFLGIAHFNTAHLDKAEPLLIKSVQENIYSHEALYNLGLIKYEKGDEVAAYNYMKKTVKIHPTHPGANYWIAGYYYKKMDFDKALFYFTNASKGDPGNSAAWEGLFYCYINLNNYEKAWEVAQKIKTEDPQIVLNIALVAEKLGKHKEALNYLENSKLSSKDIEKHKIIFKAKTGDIIGAIESTKKLLKSHAQDEPYLMFDRGQKKNVSYAFIVRRDDKVYLNCLVDTKQKEMRVDIDVHTFAIPDIDRKFATYEGIINNIIEICK